MEAQHPVLAIDVGGTSVKARWTDSAGTILAEARRPTPVNDPRGEALANLLAELATRQGPQLAAIGLVVPGIVDERAGMVREAVNLGWRSLPVAEIAKHHLHATGVNVPLAFGQDVRAGALAEARDGAAAGTCGPVAFVPIGTGVAAALVVDGEIAPLSPTAGEIGQLTIRGGAFEGQRLEEVASAAAIARRTGVEHAREAAALVQAGDRHAAEVWADAIDALAEALAWTTVVTGCNSVVIGGGLAESGDLLLAPLREALRSRLSGLVPPSLVRARYGEAAGVVGAGILARDLLGEGSLQ